jgi:hypothetical protein
MSIMAGCIREDLSDCPPVRSENNVKIDFRLFDGGVFTNNVSSVIAVVFDSAGRYIPPAIMLDQTTLFQYAGVELALAPGDYRMVFWANVGDNTEIKVVNGVPIITYKNVTGENEVLGNGDPVWYAPAIAATRAGEVPQPLEYYSFTVPEEGDFTDVVSFTETHNSVNIYIKGLPLDSAALPTVELTNLASAAEFYGMDPLTDPMPTVTSAVQTVVTEKESVFYALAAFDTSPLGDMEGIDIVVKNAAGDENYRVALINAIAESNANPGDHEIELILNFIDGIINGAVVITDWKEEELGKEY